MWGRLALGVPANSDQLCRNRDRDLLGRDGANVESDRCVDAVEQMRGHAFLLQRFKDADHFALRADHSDIAGASLHRPAQDAACRRDGRE